MTHHASRRFTRLLAFLCALLPLAAVAQTLDTGSLQGVVKDEKGAPLPGALVKARGPQGQRASETDEAGRFKIPFMVPGVYEITVTMDGYSTQVQSGVVVVARQETAQGFKLSPGSEVVTVKAARLSVDVTNTTTSTRVDLQNAVSTYAQSHDFAAAFDFAPGVYSDSGVGGGNPSISGASGLENQYVIGGVNVTNTGYGTLGTSDQLRGARDSGMTTEFLSDLEIREGGMEAEYGQALGGVVTANLIAGTNDWHGAVNALYSPRSWDGPRRVFSTANGGLTNYYGTDKLDASIRIGGPLVKDKLFIFAGYNPVWVKDHYRFDVNPSDLAGWDVIPPLANVEYDRGNLRVDNYAVHLTWNITEKHKIDAAVFGSPTTVDGVIAGGSLGNRVTTADDTGLPVGANGMPNVGALDGTKGRDKVSDLSMSLKYFGVLTPWMNLEAQYSRHSSQIKDVPAINATRFTDRRREDINNWFTLNSLPSPVQSFRVRVGGVGFYQAGSNDQNDELTLKVTHNFNAWGSHELKWGVDYADIKFHENVRYSGPSDNNLVINIFPQDPIPSSGRGLVPVPSGALGSIRCNYFDATGTDVNTACRYPGGASAIDYRIIAATLNPPHSDTTNKETNFFLQDRWQIKNVTLLLGARYTREKVGNADTYRILNTSGQPAWYNGGQLDPFIAQSYTFPAEVAPRVGVSWDVRGDGKSKIHANYGRMYERIPNDLAVRSFGNEFSLLSAHFQRPDFTGQTGGVLALGSTPTCIAGGVISSGQDAGKECVPGAKKTRLPYRDELILGYKFMPAPNYLVDVTFTFRKQGRVLEDTQSVPAEAIDNYYYTYGGVKVFPDFGIAPFGRYVLANVGENNPNFYNNTDPAVCATPSAPSSCPRVPVSFGHPENRYRAFTVTLEKDKAEGEHLSFKALYRLSRITGNYEGLFRNDNGQGDPNISSLFDFPDTPLMHGQYMSGPLNLDSTHALRLWMGYDDLLVKNLSGALTFKYQTGTPRTPLLAHPIYQNEGELPGDNPVYVQTGYGNILVDYRQVPRGGKGRNPNITNWDAKLNYKWTLGKSELRATLSVFNLLNNTKTSAFDENVEVTTGVLNPNYDSPGTIIDPRWVQLGLRWSY